MTHHTEEWAELSRDIRSAAEGIEKLATGVADNVLGGAFYPIAVANLDTKSRALAGAVKRLQTYVHNLTKTGR